MLPDPPGRFDQQHIALVMSKRIVHLLESVQVYEQQRKRGVVAHYALHILFQSVAEQSPVGKPCQVIVVGELLDLRFGYLSVRDVQQRADIVRDAPIIILHRRYGQLLGKYLAVFAPVPYLTRR